jgi:tRNA(fMet)-specific endonuclease VapC
MTLRFLLDTNVLAESLRPKPDLNVMDHLQRHQGEIAIASVVWLEMWYGCYRLPASAKRHAIESYLTQVVGPSMAILAYDDDAAIWHAAERDRLARLGKTPPYADGMIASVAKTNDLALVTFNPADFSHFRDLRIENWQE